VALIDKDIAQAIIVHRSENVDEIKTNKTLDIDIKPAI